MKLNFSLIYVKQGNVMMLVWGADSDNANTYMIDAYGQMREIKQAEMK